MKRVALFAGCLALANAVVTLAVLSLLPRQSPQGWFAYAPLSDQVPAPRNAHTTAVLALTLAVLNLTALALAVRARRSGAGERP